MTDENQNSDLTEALSLIAVSLGKINQNLERVAGTLEQQEAHSAKGTQHLKDLTECTAAIADAFYYVDGTAGSVYHMAGSLNSIKHSMPNYAPNPNSKFGKAANRRRAPQTGRAQPQFEQPVDIGQSSQ